MDGAVAMYRGLFKSLVCPALLDLGAVSFYESTSHSKSSHRDSERVSALSKIG